MTAGNRLRRLRRPKDGEFYAADHFRRHGDLQGGTAAENLWTLVPQDFGLLQEFARNR